MQKSRQLAYGKDVRVSYGIRDVLKIESFALYDGDRIGLVGANGAGKTTLLHILAGLRLPDGGHVEMRCEASLVRQADLTEPSAHSDVSPELAGRLGVVASPNPSGGERTRQALAGALSTPAPLLLLDEPTTNLDMDGISELQKRIEAHVGALVLVSHDRALLDAVCTKIWEIENGTLRVFPGAYTAYREQKSREREFQQQEYDSYRDEERRLTSRVREVEQRAKGMLKPRRNMSSSEWMLYKNLAAGQQKHVHSFARSLKSRIDQLEVKDRPDSLPEVAMSLGAGRPITARAALRVGPVNVEFPGKTILTNASFSLATGMRTVMVGANGSGKTTLLRRAMSAEEGYSWHREAQIGYFSQDHDVLKKEDSVLDNARSLSGNYYDQAVARTVLARLGLRGDDVFKPVSALSGGERAKVALARLLLADVNVLILDEPTNHLDLYAMDALQELLSNYAGTLLVVTHDRELCRAVAQRVVRVANGTVTTHEGDWASYEKSLMPAAAVEEVAERLTEDMVRMRMAVLSSRMAQKKKGDDPAQLEAEWQELLVQLRACQAEGTAGKRG